MGVFDIVTKYSEAFLNGLITTLKISLSVWGSGILLGVILGTLSARYKKAIGNLFIAFSFFLAAIPVLVLLFWVHYPMQVILGITIDPIYSAIFVISLVNIFSVANIVRNSLIDFPKQYEIAAKVCGMTSLEIFWEIKLPIVTRQIIPALLPIQIIMLHTTLFASLISVEEIFRVSQRVNSVVYKPVEIYTALAIFFLIISLPVNLLAYYLKKRYTRNISES